DAVRPTTSVALTAAPTRNCETPLCDRGRCTHRRHLYSPAAGSLSTWPMSFPGCSRRMPDPMSTHIIVSYDGTPNDDDALALGKALARGGAALALAYVRHSREFDPRREDLANHDAQRRLESGATWLGDPDIPRHIVFSASTGEGLAQLAQNEGASLLVFGSDYRTPPGRAEPGQTAQYLLEGGSTAIAVAQAGLRTNADPAITSISTAGSDADDAAQRTAQSLAQQLGA